MLFYKQGIADALTAGQKELKKNRPISVLLLNIQNFSKKKF